MSTPTLDIRTLLIVFQLLHWLSALMLGSMAFTAWQRQPSLIQFCMANFAYGLGLLLLSMRGSISDFSSIILGNGFYISGHMLIYLGLLMFLGRKMRPTQVIFIGILLIYMILLYIFTFNIPTLQGRIILTMVVGAALSIAIGLQALLYAEPAIRPGAWADLVALDGQALAIAGLDGDALLDGWIFAGDDRLVTDVWSAGRHVVTHGRHIARDRVETRYRAAIKRLRNAI